MPALEYVAGESMTSSEFSATSEQNWPWPESPHAPVAAPDHHAILFEYASSVRAFCPGIWFPCIHIVGPAFCSF